MCSLLPPRIQPNELLYLLYFKCLHPARRVLRELSGISQSDYVAQLCSDQALALLGPSTAGGSGRPGPLFFISRWVWPSWQPSEVVSTYNLINQQCIVICGNLACVAAVDGSSRPGPRFSSSAGAATAHMYLCSSFHLCIVSICSSSCCRPRQAWHALLHQQGACSVRISTLDVV
jgi:hypothetical protein